MRVFISGQKTFGMEVLHLCRSMGVDIAGVCCPLDDRLTAYCIEAGYYVTHSLRADNLPEFDLGISAHSFDYVSRPCRYKAKIGWIGYHPSLLPRHRGRSSIEWALRFKDIITGGTIYWLNSGIDRGDIAYQDWVWLDHTKTAKEVWGDSLKPIGLRLFKEAISDIGRGVIKRVPQDKRFSTFEPDLTNIKDIFKPDLLMLGHGG